MFLSCESSVDLLNFRKTLRMHYVSLTSTDAPTSVYVTKCGSRMETRTEQLIRSYCTVHTHACVCVCERLSGWQLLIRMETELDCPLMWTRAHTHTHTRAHTHTHFRNQIWELWRINAWRVEKWGLSNHSIRIQGRWSGHTHTHTRAQTCYTLTLRQSCSFRTLIS